MDEKHVQTCELSQSCRKDCVYFNNSEWTANLKRFVAVYAVVYSSLEMSKLMVFGGVYSDLVN